MKRPPPPGGVPGHEPCTETRRGGRIPGLRGLSGPSAAGPQASRFAGASSSHTGPGAHTCPGIRQKPRPAWPSAPMAPRGPGDEAARRAPPQTTPRGGPERKGEGKPASVLAPAPAGHATSGPDPRSCAEKTPASQRALAHWLPRSPQGSAAQRPRSPWQPSDARLAREGTAVGPGEPGAVQRVCALSGCPSRPLCAPSSTRGEPRGRGTGRLALPPSALLWAPVGVTPGRHRKSDGKRKARPEPPCAPLTTASAPGGAPFSCRA